MKCDICGKTIATLFLEKIKGTYFWKDGKKKAACFECQSRLKNNIKEEI